MRITRIVRHPRRDRVRIHVDGEKEPRLELALDLLMSSGLRVGDRLGPARVAELEGEDEEYRAREAALRLLAHRSRSVAELRRGLERRGLSPGAVEGTLAWLDARGYLDDRAFAESFVRDRLRLRPRGRAALERELRAKGVDEGTARGAVETVMAAEGGDEATMALDAAREWARRNGGLVREAGRSPDQRQRARRRLYGHLARRGFPPDAVRSALARVLGD
jgi:regulatory protein